MYERPKLLINSLGEIKVSIDTDQNYYCEQQVRIAMLWHDLKDVNNKSISNSIKKFSTLSRYEMENLSEKVDLKYLLGILNSKYAKSLLSNIRGGDYHIVPEHIRNIPIPNVAANQQKPIISLVDRILSTKKSDPQTDTSALERQIDEMIYKLYKLTYDEVKVIDPEFWLSEDEYKNVKLD